MPASHVLSALLLRMLHLNLLTPFLLILLPQLHLMLLCPAAFASSSPAPKRPNTTAPTSSSCNSIVPSLPTPSSCPPVVSLEHGPSLAGHPGHSRRLAEFVDETNGYNDLVLGPLFPAGLRSLLPRPLQSWLRNYVAGVVIYFGSASLWCLYIYGWRRHVYFPPGGPHSMPSQEAVLLQVWVSMKALPFYVMLPAFSEHMVEKGWSRCYSSVREVGFFRHAFSTLAYLALVEFGIYWVHRLLHDVKPLYRWLHATHHKYNKENTLSPFAGLAFHPLDGLAQALPHAVFIYLVPTQLCTHLLLLFVEGIWTTNIHDCLHGNVWPIMGAGYHTIHHCTYQHNYGHYTIWMDWMFGTLLDPREPMKSKPM